MPLSTVGKRKPVHPDHAEFFAALGRRIKLLRKERGWSLNYMYVVHGYVASQWQGFEKGKVCTIDSLLKLSELFGLDLTTLIDSLGKFPRKSMEAVAVDPARPNLTEKTLGKAAGKRATIRQKQANK